MTTPQPEVRPTRVTRITLGVNVAVFLAMVGSGVPVLDPSGLDLLRWGATYGPLTLGHEWWRLGTSMFLHVGLLHLVLNMLCLASLGPLAEVRFGPGSFLAGYLLAGVGGAVTSLAIHPDTVGAGASGAIFGIASRLLVAGWVNEPAGEPRVAITSGRLGGFLVTNLLYGALLPNIDNAAHVGGLLTGAALGLCSHRRLAHPAWVSRGSGAIALGLVILAMALGRARGLTDAQYAEVLQEVETVRQQDVAGTAQLDTLGQRIGGLEELLEQRPDSALAYLALASAYIEGGDTARATDRLRQGIQRLPSEPRLYSAFGSLSLTLGRVEAAVTAFEHAFEIDSSSDGVRYDLAVAWERRGAKALAARDSAKAVESFQRMLALARDSAQVRAARAALLPLTDRAKASVP